MFNEMAKFDIQIEKVDKFTARMILKCLSKI